MGCVLLLALLVCYSLALQSGGISLLWSDGAVITILLMWTILKIGFIISQWLQGSRAMIPLALLKPRRTWAYAIGAFS